MRAEREPLMVRGIDGVAIQPLLMAVYEAIYGQALTVPPEVGTQVLVPAWNDDIRSVDVAIIGTEGVGTYLTDSNTVEVEVYSPWGRSSTIPLLWTRVPLLDEPVDLSKHIRSFGSRLESNWALWDRRIRKASDEIGKQGGSRYASLAPLRTESVG